MDKLLQITLFGALFFSASTFAATSKVTKVGCHINSNICFAYLESSFPTSCARHDGSVRWDGESNTNGKAALSIFLTAKTTGKSVILGLSGCYSGDQGFSWVSLQ